MFYVRREFDYAVLCKDGEWRIDPPAQSVKRYRTCNTANRYGLSRIPEELYVHTGHNLYTIGTVKRIEE